MALLWKFSHLRFCLSISFEKQKIMLFDIKEILEREFLGCDYGNGNYNLPIIVTSKYPWKKWLMWEFGVFMIKYGELVN